jgi:hypothetical protein
VENNNPLMGLIAREKAKRTARKSSDMLEGFKRLVWLVENQKNAYLLQRALETNVPCMRDLISYCEGKNG